MCLDEIDPNLYHEKRSRGLLSPISLHVKRQYQETNGSERKKEKLEGRKGEEERHKGIKTGRNIGRRSKWRERRKSLWGERKAHKR